jgi:hypothetical protein
MTFTDEENEILDFYDQGMSIADLSYCYNRTVYRLKKFLQPMPDGHYIFRQLDEEFDSTVKIET